MGALSNTGQTTVTDRQAQGPIPDTSPPNGSNPGGGGGAGTVTSITAGTGLTGGVITVSGTIALANTAVVAGSYSNADITVDAQGRITSASNGSSGGGGTVTSVTAGTGLTGGTITSSGTIALANTAVTPGNYTLASITVDQQGRITAASSGSAGAGTVTSVATGAGLTGGTITSTGTIALASISTGTVLGNVSGGTTAPSATTPTSLFDNVFGNARGNVLYRGSSAWSALAPGTAGQFLKTNGAGADPAWANPSGSGTVTSVGISGANGIGVSGTPITGSGTIALTLGDISSATTKPTLTSSVVRSLGNRAADVYNVKDWGATGDGSTNDAGFIQACINSAVAASTRPIVYFPMGKYRVNTGLTLGGAYGGRISFIGDGEYGTVLLAGANSINVFDVVCGAGDSGAEFRNFTFGATAGIVATSGIKVSPDSGSAPKVIVEGVHFEQDLYVNAIWCVSATSSYFNNLYGRGGSNYDSGSGTGSGAFLRIDQGLNNTISNVACQKFQKGIAIGDGTNTWQGCCISNVNMVFVPYGIYLSGNGGGANDCGSIQITNVLIDDGNAPNASKAYALWANYVSDIQLSNLYAIVQATTANKVGIRLANRSECILNNLRLISSTATNAIELVAMDNVIISDLIFSGFTNAVNLDASCDYCRVRGIVPLSALTFTVSDSGTNNQILDLNWNAGTGKVRVIAKGVDVGGLTPV